MGGTPYTIEKNIKNSSTRIDMDAINVEQLLIEDDNRPPATPFRYGYKFDVDLSLENSGKWTMLDNGDRIWQLAVFSNDAYAICLEYDYFYLPNNSTFYIYNEDLYNYKEYNIEENYNLMSIINFTINFI